MLVALKNWRERVEMRDRESVQRRFGLSLSASSDDLLRWFRLTAFNRKQAPFYGDRMNEELGSQFAAAAALTPAENEAIMRDAKRRGGRSR